jgi:glutathione S-transferase
MTAPYQLYFSPGSASLVVHWFLIDAGIDHELIPMNLDAGEHKRPPYLELNPNGLVPTLIVDGKPVFECAALLLLLAERHPDKGYAPAVGSPDRAMYLQWMLHFANSLQPAFRCWFYPDEAAGAENVEAAKQQARGRIEAAWGRVDAYLATRPYFAGDQLTATDFLGAMLMRWSRNMPKPATEWKAIAAYVRRMKARPSFRTLYEREGLTEWA